jgi:hypothetical protein
MASSAPPSNLDKKEALLAAALLAAVVVRSWILPMFSSIWIDEWATFFIGSQGLSRMTALGQTFISDQRLISLAGWLGMQVVGQNEFGLRLYSLLSAGFCLLAIYQLGRRWFGARAALMSVLLYPCFLAVYQQVAIARAYMLAMAFFLAVLWSVELWLERKQWFWLLAAAVCGCLLVATHLLQTIGLGLVGLRILWTVRPWTQWIWPVTALVPGLAMAAHQVLSKPLANLNYLPMPSVATFLEALFPQPVAGLLLLVLAGLLGLGLGRWTGPGEGEPAAASRMRYYMLAAWLLPPLLTFGLTIAKNTSIFIPRYYFTAFPAAAWVLGSILARIEPFRSRAAAITLTAVASMAILTGSGSRPNPNHENWREAIDTLRQLRADPAEPILFHSGFLETDFPQWRDFYKPGGACHIIFTFYRFDGKFIGLPYTNHPERIAEVTPELDATLASHRRVWLLSRSARGPMMDWLDSYLAARGWRSRSMGQFESVRLDLLEPGPNKP